MHASSLDGTGRNPVYLAQELQALERSPDLDKSWNKGSGLYSVFGSSRRLALADRPFEIVANSVMATASASKATIAAITPMSVFFRSAMVRAFDFRT
jgi:hypothetical protein